MMKTLLYFAFLVTGIGFNTITLVGQPMVGPTDKDISFLKKFREDYTKSVLKQNPTLLESYYADSIRLMPPFQKTITGMKTVTRYHEAFSNRFIIHNFSKDEVEILDLQKQLMEIGTLTMRLSSKSTGRDYQLRGKYMDLWQKRDEGNPRLITEIWNYDEYYGDIQNELRFEEIPSMHQAMLPNVPVTNSIRFSWQPITDYWMQRSHSTMRPPGRYTIPMTPY